MAALCFAPPALAACTSPAGVAGDQFYNTTVDVMQFCNGTDWVNMGAAGGAAAETDPQVGTLTNTKWCTTDGTVIDCTTNAPSAGGSDMQSFASSGTWTKPATGNTVLIQCWGGGGGGGRNTLNTVSDGSNWCGGGSGAGGGYSERWIPAASLTATVAVTVGTGGAGKSSAGDGAGGNGGNSTFGSYLTAGGGGGGGTGVDGYGSQQTYLGGPAGAGIIPGAAGVTCGVGGSVSYHSGASGGAGHQTVTRAGGTSGWGGNGGSGATGATNGGAGSVPSGGGGGARSGAGGAGAAGKCVVTTF